MAQDQVAIVTGGAQGIGKATVQHLLDAGYRVTVADCDSEAGEELLQHTGADHALHFVFADVGRDKDVQRVVDATLAKFSRLDLLVNNAAVSRRQPFEELTVEAWEGVVRTNLTAPFLCAKHSARHLRRQGGVIINIASTRALMSEPNTEAYSASKGGVVALTHALAISLGPAIRVNCISPGWIEVGDWQKRARAGTPHPSDLDREQHPAGRVGTPADIAALVVYLASPLAGFITGTNIVVDGGMTRKMIYAD